MAQVLSVIPTGLSEETKRLYIKRTKAALEEAMGIPPEEVRIYITEYKDTDCCVNFREKLHYNVTLPAGKTEPQKDKFAKLYKKACDETFGSKTQPAFAVFDEHTPDDEYINGALLSRQ